MGTVAYPVQAGEPYVDPADELFSYAVGLSDEFGRRGLEMNCFARIPDEVPLRGWKGKLLRRKTTVHRHAWGWDLDTYNLGGHGNLRIMLGSNGTIYLARPEDIHHGYAGVVTFLNPLELDHCHFGVDTFAGNMIHKLEGFAQRVREHRY